MSLPRSALALVASAFLGAATIVTGTVPAHAQAPTIDNPAPDASKSDGIYTPFTNRELYQLIASDYQQIIALTNEVVAGRPLPAADILRIYEEADIAKNATSARFMRGFARDGARATEFPEAAAYFGSSTFLDDPVIDAIFGLGSAGGYTPAQRRQAIQKGILRIIYYWSARYVNQAAQTLNAGLVDEAWAIYMGIEVDGRYPNSLSGVAVSREQNFNRPGSLDVPMREAMARAQRAAAAGDAVGYAAAARDIHSRFNAIFYLSAARYLNEALRSAQEGNIENAGAQMVEGLSYYRFIQPTVAAASPEADAAMMAYYMGSPESISVERRDATLAALNQAAEALLLAPADLVTSFA